MKKTLIIILLAASSLCASSQKPKDTLKFMNRSETNIGNIMWIRTLGDFDKDKNKGTETSIEWSFNGREVLTMDASGVHIYDSLGAVKVLMYYLLSGTSKMLENGDERRKTFEAIMGNIGPKGTIDKQKHEQLWRKYLTLIVDQAGFFNF